MASVESMGKALRKACTRLPVEDILLLNTTKQSDAVYETAVAPGSRESLTHKRVNARTRE